MKNAHTICNPALLFCASLLIAGNAAAETVDYGSLEALFGEPVTTSATGTPQRVSDVAANMTIITADEIRQSGSRQIPEIIERYVPGMDLFQSGINAHDVGVRGYQQPFQPRLLVLLDGRQVFIDDYSRTIWTNIPVNIDNIRQIEVVKGASSALFGSNAAGGVVNIITYNPAYDDSNVATISVGTQNMATGDATVSKKMGEKSGISISGGGFLADEFDTDPNIAGDKHNKPAHSYVTQRSVLQLSPDVLATTEFSYSRSLENPQQPTLTARSAESSSVYALKGNLQWMTDYGTITSTNYFYRAENKSLVSGSAYPSTTDLFVSELQDQFKLGTDHTLRIGGEYRHKAYDYDFQQSIAQSPAFEHDVLSVSGTWLWQVNEQLSWTNALRLDHQAQKQTGTLFADSYYSNSDYSHIINALSANSGLVYKATPEDTIRATYGRGIQLPSFIEGSDNVVIQTGANTYVDIEGNPNLKPTVVQNYELAYDHEFRDIYSTAKIATFYEINRDLIAFAVDTSITHVVGANTYTIDQSANVGSSQGLGGELELAGANNGYRWSGSYSYARLHDSAAAASTLGYEGSTPKHHFRLSGGYTTGPWEFDASGKAVTSLNMQSAVGTHTQTDGYYALAGRIGYNLSDQFTLALSGSNLTRDETKESPFPAIERQAFLTLTGKF